MKIRQANLADLKIVKDIVHRTIQGIYPRYYPAGAVDFFLAHHSDENISADIEAQRVFILAVGDAAVGTVTVKESDICRFFVLPAYQGNGYGGALFDFSERQIAAKYEKIRVDASLPAKAIYLKRGYKETEALSILTKNGDYLFYDVMEKCISRETAQERYDGKVFIPKINSENGEVNGETVFTYHQKNNILWAEYAGGEIVLGNLLGTVDSDGALNFHYQHINQNGEIRIGKCRSVPNITENGKLELHETWQWLNGDKSSGESVIIEKQVIHDDLAR